MLAKRPYKTSPYDDMKRLCAPWLDEMEVVMRNRINAFRSLLVEEADKCGLIKFSDESFLYERFLDNKACGLAYSMAEVFKFFLIHFRLKMYHELVGEWLFTKHDVEMYNYFLTEFTCTTSSQKQSIYHFDTDIALIRRTSRTKFYAFDTEFDAMNKFLLTYTAQNGRSYAFGYFSLFKKKCDLFNDLFKHVQSGTKSGDNYFDGGNFVIGISKVECGYEEVQVKGALPTGTDINEIQKQFIAQRGSVYYTDNKDSLNAKNKKYHEEHKEEASTRAKKHYQENRDKVLARVQAYKEANPEKVKQSKHEHYIKHKDEICAYQKQYNKENKLKVAVRSKAYRDANKTVLSAKQKEYRENNKEIVAARKKKYAETHKAQIAVYQTSYRNRNRKQISENQKRYREENKESIAQYQKEYKSKRRTQKLNKGVDNG